jgi:hypothetical protein
MCNWSGERYGDIISSPCAKRMPRRGALALALGGVLHCKSGLLRGCSGGESTFLLSLDQMCAQGILAKFHNSPRWAAAAAAADG